MQLFGGVIIERNNHILLVKSADDSYGGWDFPGGRVLWSEEIMDAAVREVLEEAGYNCKLTNLIGIYQRKTGPNDEDFIRVLFSGKLTDYYKHKKIDPDISDASWYPSDKIIGNQIKLRSPEILRELNDFQSRSGYPLDVIKTYVW